MSLASARVNGQEAQEIAKSLLDLYSKTHRARLVGRILKPSGSWREVNALLGGGFNPGKLNRVAHRLCHASNKLRMALGFAPKKALADVCPKHGIVHAGRCPRKTFDERRAEADKWVKDHQKQIEAIVTWAEGRIAKK